MENIRFKIVNRIFCLLCKSSGLELVDFIVQETFKTKIFGLKIEIRNS